jgi:endoribonuclease LACTB2
MNIVNVGYDSTNYYVLADTRPRLLVDVGWPGTLPKLQHQCRRTGIQLPEIKYFLCTHYHPDHAGLAQELKRTGIQLIIMDTQVAFVPVLKTYMKPQNNYLDIDLNDNVRVNIDDSRAFLAQIGLHGEIISTPGHSEDSVTLILDEGSAFTGDLPHPMLMTDEAINPTREGWAKIRAFGVKTIYPGHGPAWPLSNSG